MSDIFGNDENERDEETEIDAQQEIWAAESIDAICNLRRHFHSKSDVDHNKFSMLSKL